MIKIEALPMKVRASDLVVGDVMVKANYLDRIDEIVDDKTSILQVGYRRYRISVDVDDFAVHEDPPAMERVRWSAWVRIVRIVATVE